MIDLGTISSFFISNALAAGAEVVGSVGSLQSVPATPINEFVAGIYDFALMAGGILAFGAIVYGAARYTVAAGNPEGQHEGRDAISQALLRLLLLFSAYLVLHTINPELTKLGVPKLVPLQAQNITNQKACAGSTYGTCTSGKTCVRTNPNSPTYECVGGTTVTGYGCQKTGSPTEIMCSPSNSPVCAELTCGSGCAPQITCTRKPPPINGTIHCGNEVCTPTQHCTNGENGTQYCANNP